MRPYNDRSWISVSVYLYSDIRKLASDVSLPLAAHPFIIMCILIKNRTQYETFK